MNKTKLVEISPGVYTIYSPPIFKINYLAEKIYSLFYSKDNQIIYLESFFYLQIKKRQKKEKEAIYKKSLSNKIFK